MKNIKAVRGTSLIHSWIEEGEHEHQDFKYAISDACKIARSISAFANNSGGRLLIGVKDNGVVAGVPNDEDIYMVELAACRYCSPSVPIDFKAYKVDGNLVVIVATVEAAARPPVTVKEGKGVYRAYYRVADSNICASDLMVKAWRRRSACLRLLSVHADVAQFVGQAGKSVDARSVALNLHISEAAAEEALADLVAVGSLKFVYYNGAFRIAVNGE